MARPLRIEFENGLYHVTARGNGRAKIFLDPGDRHRWLDLAGEVAERHLWRIYAYCQMDNHFHLLVQTPRPNLSRCMRQLNGHYSQWFNHRHGRVGHLLQGRYHALIVDREAYFLEVVRYMLLNPVRAKMAKHPMRWAWSSYCATVGEVAPPPWLAVTEVLENFGSKPDVARTAFAAFVDAAIPGRSPWESIRQNIYLGDESFVGRAQTSIDVSRRSAQEIPFAQRSKPPSRLDDYFISSKNQRTAAIAAYAEGHFTMKQIAEYLGLHYSTVSRWLAKSAMRECKT